MAVIDIKAYEREHDVERVLAVWHRAMDQTFRLTPEGAQRIFTAPDIHAFTAWVRGELVAFSSVLCRDSEAAIQAFFVDPSVQRHGIGATLHREIITQAKEQGVIRLQLGGGAPRLFPGVPIGAQPALQFFGSQGWEYSEISLDMVQSLQDYTAASYIYEAIKPLGVTLELYTPDFRTQLLTFMAQEFPGWVQAYDHILDVGDSHDCLLAVDKRQTIVAALILYGPWSHASRLDTVWQAVFGQDLGALGAVITADAHRRLGIGSALVAYGMEILKARGASHSFIGWTWAEDFYGKLGYKVWQTYKMAWRDGEAKLRPA